MSVTIAELKKKADKLQVEYKSKVLKADLEKMIKKAEDDKKKQKKKESKQRCAAVNKKTKTEAMKNYEIKQQLGLRGRDGKTFLVLDKFGYEYAMKQFRSNKSIESILEEVFFQRKCSDIGLCPRIIDVDTKNKYIGCMYFLCISVFFLVCVCLYTPTPPLQAQPLLSTPCLWRQRSSVSDV